MKMKVEKIFKLLFFVITLCSFSNNAFSDKLQLGEHFILDVEDSQENRPNEVVLKLLPIEQTRLVEGATLEPLKEKINDYYKELAKHLKHEEVLRYIKLALNSELEPENIKLTLFFLKDGSDSGTKMDASGGVLSLEFEMIDEVKTLNRLSISLLKKAIIEGGDAHEKLKNNKMFLALKNEEFVKKLCDYYNPESNPDLDEQLSSGDFFTVSIDDSTTVKVTVGGDLYGS